MEMCNIYLHNLNKNIYIYKSSYAYHKSDLEFFARFLNLDLKILSLFFKFYKYFAQSYVQN